MEEILLHHEPLHSCIILSLFYIGPSLIRPWSLLRWKGGSFIERDLDLDLPLAVPTDQDCLSKNFFMDE